MREVPSTSDERPTPRDGGMKLGAGALMADGAIREWRMWANDDRSAAWIAFGDRWLMKEVVDRIKKTYIEAYEVFVGLENELLRALVTLR